jgi:hypothetical protein
MARGRLELRARTAVRVLTGDVGMSSRIHFIDDQTGATTLGPLGAVAFQCGSCEALLVQGEGGDDALSCFECKAVIPADAAACPACGWTWS